MEATGGYSKQLAHFVGVAPVSHTSGTSVESRPHMSKRGNSSVRRMFLGLPCPREDLHKLKGGKADPFDRRHTILVVNLIFLNVKPLP